MAKNDKSFPNEIAGEVKDFHLKLVELKKSLQPVMNNLYQIRDEIEKAKDPFKAATLELTMCQTINSLFYVFLQTTGVDAKSHAVNSELFRIEQYTNRLKQIRYKAFRPKVNRRAAGAFVRNALFDPNEMQQQRQQQGDNWSDEEEGEEKQTTNAAGSSETPANEKTSDLDDSIREKPAKRMRTK